MSAVVQSLGGFPEFLSDGNEIHGAGGKMRSLTKSASGGKKLTILILALFILGMPLVASAAKVSQKSETI
jgi:hypothetical protein